MKKIDFSQKKRIVVKVGSNSLTHPDTGYLDYIKIERLVMELCNLSNMNRDVVLVTSGAIATGRQTLDLEKKGESVSKKQALASIGQARLMSLYEKFFFEFAQIPGQVLLTKMTMMAPDSRRNAINTFEELFKMDVIPIVNANDTISTFEIQYGDNDTLSALVAEMIGADLLILLTDIEGLYTGNPRVDKAATLIPYVEHLSEEHFEIAGGAGTEIGTGGMKTKLRAGRIATASGIDMIIASGMDMRIITRIMEGESCGTVFFADPCEGFDPGEYIQSDRNL